ncbi:MAG: DNA repair protein RecO [Chlamydiales bacterium]|nr:DNA repair protein RecO [Chlamydiales bacterium]
MSEGIVLKSVDFRENKRIVTIFTAEHGLITAFIPSIKTPQRLNLSSPLTRAEWQLKPGKGDLWKFLDASILELHLPIRQDLERLQVARYLLSQMLETQMPHKPTPALYALLRSFLNRLKTTSNPLALRIAFHLKLLLHEGLFSLDPHCATCQITPGNHFHDGLLYCGSCKPPRSPKLTSEQHETLHTLATTRSFSGIEAIDCQCIRNVM